ncbi:MAG: DNA-binding protein MutS2 [Methanocella sp. PtaU1.Bin125]|nr:MAG: DNA-binding protein MutS2 [Methanocella sp. PtaU1.Bin125]
MKAFLMYRDRDFDAKQPLPWNEQSLRQDLALDTLFAAMAAGDEFIFEVSKRAVLTGIHNRPDDIFYRQDVLKDCRSNPAIVRNIYRIAAEGLESEKKNYLGFLCRYPSGILSRSIEILQLCVEALRQLRNIADEYAGRFMSDGFVTLFTTLKRELSDDYFATIEGHLTTLKFSDGVLMSAGLGRGNKGVNYVLHRPSNLKQGWLERVFGRSSVYAYTIADRDEAGARALSELRDRGIDLVANALAQSCDHILSFFNALRTELAFYIGCLNLDARLSQLGAPVCFPVPSEAGERRHTCQGLYDVCLALTMKQKVVGNELNADDKTLVIITGANQGGKSTFLRSIGQAQLMMHSGMFVAAESFSANVCDNLFTHYRREEDATMSSGKLDEELSRMNDIVNHISPDSMLLFNESFAATNEREGSEIARQIVTALIEQNLKVCYVTHLYDFAHSFFERKPGNAIFLRAVRQDDGKRTYQLIEGEPLQTSYGKDLYIKMARKNPKDNLAVSP